jgi:deoxyribodipyrimidine photo-lyase
MADNLAQRLGIRPGYKEALKILTRFIDLRADNYAQKSNDPNGRALSGLSPYLHFGHISSQEIALEIIKAPIDPASKDAFLEQLIVRRELADNFCWYEPAYMSVKSFPEWAVKTLKEHARDPRPLVYSLDQLENARTHDALWNACQLEMAHTGIMQGYLRMYWAKKILQWSPDYIQAHERVIRLNDKYSIDGRDSNGYTGAAWAVGGVHDRPWSQRAIFGKIRYMNRRGCERKFDVKAYIRAVEQKTGQPVSPDYPVAQY